MQELFWCGFIAYELHELSGQPDISIQMTTAQPRSSHRIPQLWEPESIHGIDEGTFFDVIKMCGKKQGQRMNDAISAI